MKRFNKILAYVLTVACMVASMTLLSSCSGGSKTPTPTPSAKTSAPAATNAYNPTVSVAPLALPSELTGDLASIKKAGTLKVGMECNYAPFNWTQATSSSTSVALAGGGYADGYDVQIAKRLAASLGVKLEIVKLEWEGLIPALEAKKIDAIIAGMSPTAERKVSIDFSASYYSSELVMVVKGNGKYAGATSIADFSGAKVTGQIDTFHYTVIDQIQGVSKQTAMADFPTMIVALQSGKIDGYISELPGAVSAVKANSDLKYIKFADGKGFKASEEDVAIAVGLRKGSNLADLLNKSLDTIKKDEREKLMMWAIDNQPLVK